MGEGFGLGASGDLVLAGKVQVEALVAVCFFSSPFQVEQSLPGGEGLLPGSLSQGFLLPMLQPLSFLPSRLQAVQRGEVGELLSLQSRVQTSLSVCFLSFPGVLADQTFVLRTCEFLQPLSITKHSTNI